MWSITACFTFVFGVKALWKLLKFSPSTKVGSPSHGKVKSFLTKSFQETKLSTSSKLKMCFLHTYKLSPHQKNCWRLAATQTVSGCNEWMTIYPVVKKKKKKKPSKKPLISDFCNMPITLLTNNVFWVPFSLFCFLLSKKSW